MNPHDFNSLGDLLSDVIHKRHLGLANDEDVFEGGTMVAYSTCHNGRTGTLWPVKVERL